MNGRIVAVTVTSRSRNRAPAHNSGSARTPSVRPIYTGARAKPGAARAGDAHAVARSAVHRTDGCGFRRPRQSSSRASTGSGWDSMGRKVRSKAAIPPTTTLAVGPDHIVQIVNTRLAIYTKKGSRFDATGRVLYGPVPTNTVFAGLGGPCDARNNGDAVVRYDQLANRWLIVMPIFSRIPLSEIADRPPASEPARPGQLAARGQASSPGAPAALPEHPVVPPPPPPGQRRAGAAGRGAEAPPPPPSTYAMCYAISTGTDPMGPYYRYAFERPLFPDYPRPAVWPDGYYVPTSTGDNRISETVATEKHACVVDRARMLQGAARDRAVRHRAERRIPEQCRSRRDGAPARAARPNIVMAAGGTQLDKVFDARPRRRVAVSRRLEASVEDEAPRAGAHPGRALSLSVRRPADQLRPAAGHRPPPRRAGRQDHGAARLSADRRSRVDRRRAFGEYGSRRWRRALVRIRGGRRSRAASPSGSRAPMPPTRSSAGCQARQSIGWATSAIGYSFGGAPNFAGQRVTGRRASDPPGER